MRKTNPSDPQPPQPVEKLWTVSDVADFLGLRPDTIRKYLGTKRIPYYKIFGSVRFAPAEIRTWAKDYKVEIHEVWRK
jgi:excisionase family DNA binding protein